MKAVSNIAKYNIKIAYKLIVYNIKITCVQIDFRVSFSMCNRITGEKNN